MRTLRRAPLWTLLAAVLASVAFLVTGVGLARAAAPAPCTGQPQITDVAGDGHHPNEDVTAGWLSEQSGHLQAVIQVREAVWEPAHDDSEAASFALLFSLGGQVRYVRVEAPRTGPDRFDFGVFVRDGTPRFQTAGTTTGTVTAGPDGYAVIDVPAETGAVAGAKLAGPFVLTWDGTDGAEPHWVDRAPGGVSPDEGAVGADVVVGSCAGTAAPPPPGSDPTAPPSVTTSAVQLSAPEHVTGSRRLELTGRVLPARGGVPVTLTATAPSRTLTATTAPDGTFTVPVAVGETMQLRAEAEGIDSQTLTVTMRSAVTLRVVRTRGGGAVLSGRVRPALPGRVLLLRTSSAIASARATARAGRFSIRLKHPRPGRYQAVFVPAGGRAERSTSPTGAIR